MSPRDIICFECKHFDELNGNCAAFEEIPETILHGNIKHDKPTKAQGNNIVFESI